MQWSSPAPPARSRAGFTLVELLIALVIGGIVVSVVYQVLRGQLQFASYQTAREEVQQNSRAGADLIAGELRGVANLGLRVAGATEVEIHVPRIWGVVCASGASRVVVLFPEFGSGPFGTAAEQVAARRERLAYRAAGTWNFAAVGDETLSRQTDARTACMDELNPEPAITAAATDAARARWFTAAALANPPQAGALAYVYDVVRYEVGPTSVPGEWILRNDEPLAGPLPTGADAGLRFRYFNDEDLELTSLPLGDVDRASVRRIRVEVVTESEGRVNGTAQTERKVVDVFLRNLQ
jgi:prepilin-type N-terminal cleavage/methylation domain-containing protein